MIKRNIKIHVINMLPKRMAIVGWKRNNLIEEEIFWW